MARRLTQKQETFCLKYFELGNASEAALIAGYAPKAVRQIASENLTKANIIARIEEFRKKVEDEAIAKTKEIQKHMTEILRARLSDFVTIGADGAWFDVGPEKMNNGGLASASSRTIVGKDGADDAVIIKVSLHDPMKAADILNKMQGNYAPERIEHTGKDGGPIEVDYRAIFLGRIYNIIERKGQTEIPENTNQ